MFHESPHNHRKGDHPDQTSLCLKDAYDCFLTAAKPGIRHGASTPQFIGKQGLGRRVINALSRLLSDNLSEPLLQTHQLRILNPHLQSVIINGKGKGGADVVRWSYMAMVELYRPDEPQSYVLIASTENGYLFKSPVAHFLHFLDVNSQMLAEKPYRMNWSVKPALSPQALVEAIDTFEDLKSSQDVFLGDFLREELSDLLEYDDPSDPRIDERCQITRGKNGSLEMYFDRRRISGFAVDLDPHLLTLRCHFPSSLITHAKRTREDE